MKIIQKLIRRLTEAKEPTHEQKMQAIENVFGRELRLKVDRMNELGAEVRARCTNVKGVK